MKNTEILDSGTRKESDAVFPSVEDLARHLRLSRHSTYEGLRAGTIPGIRVGKRFVLPRAAIAEWLRTAGAVNA
jgi:excisionase family DNA binding protein